MSRIGILYLHYLISGVVIDASCFATFLLFFFHIIVIRFVGKEHDDGEWFDLQFRFDHIDVQFVANVWIVFRLTESEPGNIDILQMKVNRM